MELNNLLELLEQEKEADLVQFRQKVQRLSLAERKEQGFAWYPVKVEKTGYTIGERAFVILRKEDTGEDVKDQFRSGKLANFYTLRAEEQQRECSGVIHYVDKTKMKIILNTRDLPNWIGKDQLGVDLLFDERPYVEMKKALKKVIKAKKDRLALIRDIFLGKETAKFKEFSDTAPMPPLNQAQTRAVHTIMNSLDVAIVHGPPGTGKTTTLVKAIEALTQFENTVLVTAPSNTAVDLLTERLTEIGLNVVRVGHISRVDESLLQHTLEARVAKHPESKNIKKVKVQAAEYRRKAQKYKRRFGPSERMERYRLMQEARELSSWANQLEDRLIDEILSTADVIACTLVGAAHPVLERYKFRTVVIDEAAQALEPACWIPIIKASKVVMAGDPFQLPPTVKSLEARKGGLGVTLIEKAIQRFDLVELLNVQYRMNRHIMYFSNRQFYNLNLKAHESVADVTLPKPQDQPVVFVDTAGCGFGEELEPEYQSRYNPGEFNILREHLYTLLEAFPESLPPAIGIISPYREQMQFIKRALAEDTAFEHWPLSIDTIDGFQGQEREIIYISLVRSNEKGEIGFLKDYRRMNVAMTRAKKMLVVIGDSATIGADSFYSSFLDYCERKGKYLTAWEFMK